MKKYFNSYIHSFIKGSGNNVSPNLNFTWQNKKQDVLLLLIFLPLLPENADVRCSVQTHIQSKNKSNIVFIKDCGLSCFHELKEDTNSWNICQFLWRHPHFLGAHSPSTIYFLVKLQRVCTCEWNCCLCNKFCLICLGYFKVNINIVHIFFC